MRRVVSNWCQSLLLAVSMLLSNGCIKKTKTVSKTFSTIEEVQSLCSTSKIKTQLLSTLEEDKAQVLESIKYYESQARVIYYKLLLDRFLSTIEHEKKEAFGEKGLIEKWTPLFGEKLPQCLSLIKSCADENWKSKKEIQCKDKSAILTAFEDTLTHWQLNALFSLSDSGEARKCFGSGDQLSIVAEEDEMATISQAIHQECQQNTAPWFVGFMGTDKDLNPVIADLTIASRVFDGKNEEKLVLGFCKIQSKIAENNAASAKKDKLIPWVQAGISIGAQVVTTMATEGAGAASIPFIDWALFAARNGAILAKLAKLDQKLALVHVASSDKSSPCTDSLLDRQRDRIHSIIVANMVGKMFGTALSAGIAGISDIWAAKISTGLSQGTLKSINGVLKIGQFSFVFDEILLENLLSVCKKILDQVNLVTSEAWWQNFQFGMTKAFEAFSESTRSKKINSAKQVPENENKSSLSTTLIQRLDGTNSADFNKNTSLILSPNDDSLRPVLFFKAFDLELNRALESKILEYLSSGKKQSQNSFVLSIGSDNQHIASAFFFDLELEKLGKFREKKNYLVTLISADRAKIFEDKAFLSWSKEITSKLMTTLSDLQKKEDISFDVLEFYLSYLARGALFSAFPIKEESIQNTELLKKDTGSFDILLP